MNALYSSSLLVAFVSAMPCVAAGLPDTGQGKCYTFNTADTVGPSDPASIARDAGGYPRQDCRYGRDVATTAGLVIRTGLGARGFDYSKIANNGTAVPSGAALGSGPTDWACTRDNITGLTWEIKTSSSNDLRSSAHTYTWYSADGGTNGGNAGVTGPGACNGTLPGGACNTAAYVTAVNAATLCGYSDWRLPSPREMLGILFVDDNNVLGLGYPDPGYFPNTPLTNWWTAATYAVDPTKAWYMYQSYQTQANDKASAYQVRLVRGAPF